LRVNDARKRKETVGFNTGSWPLFGELAVQLIPH